MNDREEAVGTPVANNLFDWIFAGLCAWLVGGAYLDGWAHTHLSQLETFFTPWHGVLYSGFAAQLALLGGIALVHRRRGSRWRDSVPTAYRLSFLGGIIFLIGGVGDMLWHVVFGIEADVDALLSPTHLILALGAALIVTGPLRASDRSVRAVPGIRRGLPRTVPWQGVVALALLLNVFTFFTQYAHPWVQQLPSLRYWTDVEDVIFYRQALGVTSILLQSGILIGLLLYGQRRLPLPVGGISLIVALNAISVGLMRDRFDMVPGSLAAAIIVDVALLFAPNTNLAAKLRYMAFGLPLFLYSGYFITLLIEGGLWWSVHMVTGSIALAGVAGALLTLIVPKESVLDRSANHPSDGEMTGRAS